ncbi:hypothetical protein [Streptosporangium subroseum]|uniref:hypothetical protein n=1 Tax=Streptosporangium subroseum TaxID=106412 RepID=UPI00117CBDD2|nr:hypothetical protein [Streptosporangium subroseum]
MEARADVPVLSEVRLLVKLRGCNTRVTNIVNKKLYLLFGWAIGPEQAWIAPGAVFDVTGFGILGIVTLGGSPFSLGWTAIENA